MAATLTGNLVDLVGEAIPTGGAAAYIDFANIPAGGVFVDIDADTLRVGRKKIDLQPDGAFTVDGLIDNPALFYTLTVRYRVASEERKFRSEAFSLPAGITGVGDIVYTDLSEAGQTVLQQAVAAKDAALAAVADAESAAERAEVAAGNAGGAIVTGPPASARIDIVTAGKAAITSKETYLPATLAITGVPGVADYAGTARIRGRGNQTWTLPKKPYKLKPDSKAPLMGMPSNDDWALLANYDDRSFLNTAVAFEIGRMATGLDWTPRSEFGQLHLNGAYNGLYQLTESAKFGEFRINASKATGTTGLPATGAFLLEVDARLEENNEVGFRTSQNIPVIFDDPDGTVSQHYLFVQSKVQAFEDALFGSDYTDPDTGYRAHIDVDSFIDWYLVEELARNYEALLTPTTGSSAKFYLTRATADTAGRFFMGPLWDFDHSFGDTIVGEEMPPEGFRVKNSTWFARLFSDAWFAEQVATRWTTLAANLTESKVAALVNGLTARVASAALVDQTKWSYSADWAALRDYKIGWINARVQWLTDQFTPPTVAPGQVTGLAAGTPTETTVPLSWNRPATGGSPSGYFVEYRPSGGSTWTAGPSTLAARTATVTGLSSATAYEFRVTATNVVGSGTPSATVTATTSVPSFAPTDITGLAAWYDASDAASVTQSGGTVSQWNDKSGNSRHLTQGNGGLAPTFVSAAMNGRSVARFDGINDHLVSTLPMGVATRTLYIVVKFNGFADYQSFIASSGTGGLDWRVTPTNGAPQALIQGTAMLADGTGNNIAAGGAHLLALTLNGSNSTKIRTDGASTGTGSASIAFTGSRTLRVGMSVDNAAAPVFPLNGDIGEIVVVDRNLDGHADDAAIVNYLKAKWGTP